MKNSFVKYFGIVLLVLLLPLAFAKSIFFIDVAPTHKNFLAITYLREKGILNGFADNTFRPDQKINRAETLKILILGSGLTTDGVPTENPFPDVIRSEWYAPFIHKAKSLDIIQGTKDGEFEPERTVNRAEALKMLIRANGIEISEAKKAPYLDVPKEEWFSSYSAFAKDNNFFDDPSYVRPAENLTRGELAEIFFRLEKWKENHPQDIGRATYYADYFDGRGTSSGEVFDRTKFTAAHQTFPFSTRVLVTNLQNSKSVVVYINDRGPYAEGNIIDLTTAAFQELAPLSQGVATVKVKEMPADTPLGPVTSSTCKFDVAKKTINKNAYAGIILNNDLPAAFRKNEIFEIEGVLAEGISANIVTVFFGEERFEGIVQNKKFSIPIILKEIGKFNLGIISGESGTSTVFPIEIFNIPCEPNFATQAATKPHDLKTEIYDSRAYFSWEDAQNNLFLVKFIQGDKEIDFYVNGKKKFSPSPRLFSNFTEGLAKVEVWGVTKDDAFSISQNANFNKGVEKNIFITRHYKGDVREGIQDLVLPNEFDFGSKIEISGKTDQKLKDNALVILPNGQMIEVKLSLSGNAFNFSYTPSQVGTHIVEINTTQGFAIINAPIAERGFIPLLPDFWDLGAGTLADKIDLAQNRIELLKLVNNNRSASGLGNVVSDKYLDALAQFRAEDMRDRNYFSHIDPDGKSANDYRAEHAVKTPVSENIAIDINIRSAHEGLWRSALHRLNIFGGNHEKLGIGLAEKATGEIIVVELFASSPFDTANIEDARVQFLEVLNGMRDSLLAPSVTLDAVAQNWTEKMITENFFDFSNSSSGESLEKALKNAGVTQSSSALIFQENSFADLLDRIRNKEGISGNEIFEDNWDHLGVGIYADDVGTLKATIIVSE